MQYFIYLYLIIYISYVILGPHFIARFIKQDKINVATNLQEIIRRMFFLSYLAYLYNAYYFYNPNIETFINALVINFLALIAFIIKWYKLRNDDPYYYTGIIMHIIVILPVILSSFKVGFIKNKIGKGNKSIFGLLSQFTTLFIIIYFIIEKNIYTSGLNIDDFI